MHDLEITLTPGTPPPVDLDLKLGTPILLSPGQPSDNTPLLDGSKLAADKTEIDFQWNGIAGAARYQLDLYEDDVVTYTIADPATLI